MLPEIRSLLLGLGAVVVVGCGKSGSSPGDDGGSSAQGGAAVGYSGSAGMSPANGGNAGNDTIGGGGDGDGATNPAPGAGGFPGGGDGGDGGSAELAGQSNGDAGSGGERTQVLIDFDDIPSGEVVTTQYSGVTFSSESGRVLRTYRVKGLMLGTSEPNMLGAGPTAGYVDFMGDVFLDFNPAVSDIRFVASGASKGGVVAHVRLYAGATLLTTYDLLGSVAIAQSIILDGFSGVTRLEIDYLEDDSGIGWDDFQFSR